MKRLPPTRVLLKGQHPRTTAVLLDVSLSCQYPPLVTKLVAHPEDTDAEDPCFTCRRKVFLLHIFNVH